MGDMLMMNSLGDGSTLNLDFTTGVLDSRLTFTRSTTATYINSSGYVTSAAINAPRFDYSPTNIGEPRGLLIEDQAVNVCPQSQALTTGWQNVSMNTPTVPSSPTITDPFGGTSATWKLVASSSATSVPHTWRHATLTFTAASYTFSFWAKAAEYDRIMLCDPGRGRGGCLFVLTGNGTATVVANIVTPTNPQITPYPNGWYRCSVTMVLSAENYAFGISGYPSSGATTGAFGPNYISNGTSGVYATAMQIELGSGASSYIPTGASGVTRNADNCSMYDTTLTGSLSWLKNATQGTFFIEATKRFSGTTFAGALFGTEAIATNDFMLYQAIGNNWLSFNWGGDNITNYTALSAPFLIKAAVALSAGTPAPDADNMVSINGTNSALNTASNVALPFATNIFCIGSRAAASGSVPSQNYADSAIRRIKFFPTALTAAQLNALTTP
jgi:hypothetical protein